MQVTPNILHIPAACTCALGDQMRAKFTAIVRALAKASQRERRSSGLSSPADTSKLIAFLKYQYIAQSLFESEGVGFRARANSAWVHAPLGKFGVFDPQTVLPDSAIVFKASLLCKVYCQVHSFGKRGGSTVASL